MPDVRVSGTSELVAGEVRAMAECSRALDGLPDDSQIRVLKWLETHYGKDPGGDALIFTRFLRKFLEEINAAIDACECEKSNPCPRCSGLRSALTVTRQGQNTTEPE